MEYSLSFPTGVVTYHFSSISGFLSSLTSLEKPVFITDSHIAELYKDLLAPYNTIVIPAGENNKRWENVAVIAEQLTQLEAGRTTRLIGIGGGMITDMAGFVAGIYMRGIPCGFIPTSLLGMVDAAIGGKNGVNLGLYKNMMGTIRQPEFILSDPAFLQTLPGQEWSNGFAEIIKYACIFDEALFEDLSGHDIPFYRNNPEALQQLIERCVGWKNRTVLEDEQEKGNRKLLNFGHTAGHALEQKYELPHGAAVGLGMLIACILSEHISGLSPDIKIRLGQLLQQYHLPVKLDFDVKEVMEILKMDKKRTASGIDYIILEAPGRGVARQVTLPEIQKALESFVHGSHR